MTTLNNLLVDAIRLSDHCEKLARRIADLDREMRHKQAKEMVERCKQLEKERENAVHSKNRPG